MNNARLLTFGHLAGRIKELAKLPSTSRLGIRRAKVLSFPFSFLGFTGWKGS